VDDQPRGWWFGITDDTITHWMPLPEPPAQEQRES
jgi:hypothetical protein